MDPKIAYLENQVNSATPNGLIVLLYDGLVNFATTACENLVSAATNADHNRAAADATDRCIRIVTELNNSLNYEKAPELCDRLSNLYAFFISEFSRALVEHNPKTVSDMIPLFKELRETWKNAELLTNQNAVPST